VGMRQAEANSGCTGGITASVLSTPPVPSRVPGLDLYAVVPRAVVPEDLAFALLAVIYTTGMEHSPTSATGTAWERTPWHATQRATWEALGRGD